MPFEMRKLTSFSMKKLCYDLKLEMFEQMKPNDAIELVKVNAEFRLMLLRTPWIVFGDHVHEIYIGGSESRIEKFPRVHFGGDLQLPLIKQIHSFDRLWIDLYRDYFSDEQATILNQLNSVKRLWLDVNRTQCLLKVLENFRSMIEESTWIEVKIDLLEENRVVSELFKNFIANQVNDCEKVVFRCRFESSFRFFYDAFAKTSIKFFKMWDRLSQFEEIVQSIVNKLIPSKNLKAAFYVNAACGKERNARIVDFHSQFPGMKRFDGENNQEVIQMGNELVEKHVGYCLGDFTNDGFFFFRRNIDSSRDCVYILSSDFSATWTEFLAFYVQPQSEMLEL